MISLSSRHHAPMIASHVPEDEQLIQQVVELWGDAWNRHDMARMAELVSDDADFVNVWGMHWHGRAEIEREHAERHRTTVQGQRVDHARREAAVHQPGRGAGHCDGR
jgi:uncharacterized protein (TIGR02246 family)